MSKTGPDVVSDEGLRELVSLGYQVMVVCLKPVLRKDGIYYGLWGIRCMSMDGKSDKVLIAARKDEHGDRPRLFKTLTGLVGFLLGLGFRTITIPMDEGARVGHNLLHHGPEPL